MTKTIALTLNGVHGYQTHRVRASLTFVPAHKEFCEELWFEGCEATDATVEVEPRWLATITPSAQRKFECRMSNCSCGEGVPKQFELDEYDFERLEAEIKGNYPQR